MPLFEFRCLKCQEIFELLVMGEDEQLEMKCPHCSATDFERVLSSTSYCMSGDGDSNSGPSAPKPNLRRRFVHYL